GNGGWLGSGRDGDAVLPCRAAGRSDALRFDPRGLRRGDAGGTAGRHGHCRHAAHYRRSGPPQGAHRRDRDCMSAQQALPRPQPARPGNGEHGGGAPIARVGGVPVSTLSLQALIRKMLEDAPLRRSLNERAALIFDCNGQGLSMNASDPAFRADLAQADLIHADGQIIVAASRWLGGPVIANRSSTTDMFMDSLKDAAAAGVSYYLLGGEETVNAQCARRITEIAPGLNVAGHRNGFW